jgi:hypothetical protein
LADCDASRDLLRPFVIVPVEFSVSIKDCKLVLRAVFVGACGSSPGLPQEGAPPRDARTDAAILQ